MLCSKCGSEEHEEANCPTAAATGGSPGGGPDDSDLEPIGGAGRSRRKAVVGGLIGLAIVGAIGGLIALFDGGSDGASKAKTVATAPAAPTGDKIELGCSIPSVGDEVEARCEWAKDGGVTFADLRWDDDVLKGTLVVTMADGRVYRSAEEMVVKAQKAKTPITFLAKK